MKIRHYRRGRPLTTVALVLIGVLLCWPYFVLWGVATLFVTTMVWLERRLTGDTVMIEAFLLFWKAVYGPDESRWG